MRRKKSAAGGRVVLLFDTETTGLTLHPSAPLARQPKMIEFGGLLVDADTGTVLSEESFLVNPEEKITDEIIGITGITNDQLSAALPFVNYAPRVASLLARADTLVAHNLPFDVSILQYAFERLENPPAYALPRNLVCTVATYREEFGYNPKLTELYEAKLGRKLAQTHRALDDVKALWEIFNHENLCQFLI